MPTAQRVEDDETAIERERGLRAGQAEEVCEAADGPGMALLRWRMADGGRLIP
jgi:hypothetical protein